MAVGGSCRLAAAIWIVICGLLLSREFRGSKIGWGIDGGGAYAIVSNSSLLGDGVGEADVKRS